jgi:hypothetical protein
MTRYLLKTAGIGIQINDRTSATPLFVSKGLLDWTRRSGARPRTRGAIGLLTPRSFRVAPTRRSLVFRGVGPVASAPSRPRSGVVPRPQGLVAVAASWRVRDLLRCEQQYFSCRTRVMSRCNRAPSLPRFTQGVGGTGKVSSLGVGGTGKVTTLGVGGTG